MRIEPLCSERTEAYDRYLLGQDGSLFYYSSKYKNFLKHLLGCEEEYLLAVQDGAIHGVCPLMYLAGKAGRVYNSLPYYGSNGGIMADNSDAYALLASAYRAIAASASTLSSTIISNPLADQDASAIPFNYADSRVGQFTSIAFRENQWDEILACVDASARRNIKKAMREAIIVERDPSQLDRLRELHQDSMASIGGHPKADEFFRKVPEHFDPGVDYDLYVARLDGAVAAALLVFYFNKTVEYYTPAVAAEFRSMQPLALIIITAMAEAARRGFVWWNWGGTWTSQLGVYRYKRKWAAIERKYRYYTQLNDDEILSWSQSQILSTFPNFFVVPFSALRAGVTHGQ